jgi:chromosomal replication initiation ATPase DnaA
MKSQLTLTFGETLAYSSETFVAHIGVREITETLITLAAEQRFALVYINGSPASGKTHLSVYCAGLLQSLGRSVEFLSEANANPWLLDAAARTRARKGGVFIVDDAERWISQPAAEGVFTAVADYVLQEKGLLVLLSSLSANAVNAPIQIRSRLAAGVQLMINEPEERDLDAILRAMSAQRGLKLTEVKRRFILARVPRTVPALTRYLTKLKEVGQMAPSSTSFEVLAQALE